MNTALRLFVYGSLKRQEYNWHIIESAVDKVTAARLRARMFLRPDGYPALRVPLPRGKGAAGDGVTRVSLLLGEHGGAGRVGTLDYRRDLAAAWQALPPACSPLGEGDPWVDGQLLLLNPGPDWLERLDEFEGFFPGKTSEYLRVLAPLQVDGHWQQAWTYCAAADPTEQWPAIAEWTGSMVGKLSPYQHGLK